MIHIILYQPEKPANTGNILRLASAIDAKVHLIGPLTFKLDDKDFKRAGMDYLKFVEYDYFSDYNAFKKEFDEDKIFYISRYGIKNYASINFAKASEDIYLMFGKESTGIPKDILKSHKEKTLRIPMKPNARSLNLANSVAIIVYEVLRQENFPDLATFEAIKKDVI